MYHLVVIQDFGPYKKGSMITAADEVEMILKSPQHTHVNKINAPKKAETAPAKTEVAPAKS